MEALERIAIDCPYCGERVDLVVEPADGPQRYVEDCAVCCRPWQVDVALDRDGDLRVSARRDDDA
jgi:hypothetical protein